MQMKWIFTLAGFALILILSGAHAQERLAGANLYIDADGRLGQGYTFWRGEDCFVVTVDHVVHDKSFDPPVQARSIELTGQDGARGEADFVRSALIDLALLKVRSNVSRLCGDEPADVLFSHRGYVLVYRRASGDRDFVPVYVTREYLGGDLLEIAAQGTDIQFGLSGSSIFYLGTRVGVVETYNPEEGIATIYRSSFIKRYFNFTHSEPSQDLCSLSLTERTWPQQQKCEKQGTKLNNSEICRSSSLNRSWSQQQDCERLASSG